MTNLLINKSILSKGWKRFQIMHKDRHVASIREDGTCTIYYPSFMPYNLYLEKAAEDDFDTKLNNLTNFYYWCASRVLSLDRKYLKEILNSIGASQASTDKERAMIAISYHGLSLTDVYWIKVSGETLTYNDLSLFRHSLSGAFADVSLKGKQLTANNAELISDKEAAGDVSTLGMAPKAWIREKSSFYLVKDGDKRDVEAEILASKIADCFKLDHVKYSLSSFKDKLVSKSKIITSEDFSIVPMEYIEIYCLNKGIKKMEFILKKDAYAFYMMNIIDYLVGNTDRHWGNWGFLVDNNTNELLHLHALMDFNKSFMAYDTLEGSRCLTTEEHLSQKDAAIQAVKAIGLNQIKSIDDTWFGSAKTRKMFYERLNLLKQCNQ